MQSIHVQLKIPPTLDPDFVPAALWNRAFEKAVREQGDACPVILAMERPDGTCFHRTLQLFPDVREFDSLNLRYVERMLKFLLWQRGGNRVWMCGCDSLVHRLNGIYSDQGARAFDLGYFGETLYDRPFELHACNEKNLPSPKDQAVALGGHLEGCRIGFDLGGSDRKAAAVIDGEVVFSEEIPWNPYFEKDPQYHIDGIQDSLERAAAHLPRVDAIGGSAAGVYVNNEVKAASLFRGLSDEDFQNRIRPLFNDLRKAWGDIPFDVVNDGEVTALAGSMSLDDGALLGISMGTSEAGGYCDPNRQITTWLNELAFAPVDYRKEAPVDEWSGDHGCGVQYFSQQGVARLAPAAGFHFPEDMPFPERLKDLQKNVSAGDSHAKDIFDTLGVCFGYTLAHYADFYELRHVLILGRVTSGEGGERILANAEKVLAAEFPELNEQLSLSMPDEKMKRHGQAVAAASLPALETSP